MAYRVIVKIPSRLRDIMQLNRFGLMAKAHWAERCPKLYKELEDSGQLEEMLYATQEQTATDLFFPPFCHSLVASRAYADTFSEQDPTELCLTPAEPWQGKYFPH